MLGLVLDNNNEQDMGSTLMGFLVCYKCVKYSPIYYMQAKVLSICNAFSHIILPITLWKDGIIYPSFTDDET